MPSPQTLWRLALARRRRPLRAKTARRGTSGKDDAGERSPLESAARLRGAEPPTRVPR